MYYKVCGLNMYPLVSWGKRYVKSRWFLLAVIHQLGRVFLEIMGCVTVKQEPQVYSFLEVGTG